MDSCRPHDWRCPREKSWHLAHSRPRTRDVAGNHSTPAHSALDPSMLREVLAAARFRTLKAQELESAIPRRLSFRAVQS